MPHCPICASEKRRDLLQWKHFTIYRCGNCQLQYCTPLPSDEELTAFYQGFLFKPPTAENIEKQTVTRKKEMARLFGWSADDNLNDKHFLDYGGGTGMVFHAVSALGLQAYYQDLDESAKAFTRQQFGLRDDQIIEDIETTDQQFDYILADNVIEHIKDPIAFTQRLVDKLTPGGQLVIKTPHGGNTEMYFVPKIILGDYFRNGLKYNSFGKMVKGLLLRFWHCDPPRHLYSFSKKSFHKLVEKLEGTGLKAEVDYYRLPPFLYSLSKQFFSKDKRLSVPLSILVRIVLLPVVLLELLGIGLQQLLLRLGVLSPAGIILRVRKVR